jgi:hypothetical protein
MVRLASSTLNPLSRSGLAPASSASAAARKLYCVAGLPLSASSGRHARHGLVATPPSASRASLTMPTDVSTPVSDAKAISYLRSSQITLTYDPRSETLQADSAEAATAMIDRAS